MCSFHAPCFWITTASQIMKLAMTLAIMSTGMFLTSPRRFVFKAYRLLAYILLLRYPQIRKSGRLRSGEKGSQRFFVGAPSCWKVTMSKLTACFFLSAWLNLFLMSAKYQSVSAVTGLPFPSSKKYCLMISCCPMAHHTVTLFWLSEHSAYSCGYDSAHNYMFSLFTCPLRWQLVLSLKKIKSNIPELYLILWLRFWHNANRSFLLRSVWCYQVWILQVKSLRSCCKIQIADAFEILTSCESRLADICGDSWRCSQMSKSCLEYELTMVDHCYLYFLFPTLQELGVAIRRSIVFLVGTWLLPKSLTYCLCVWATDFVAK